MDAPAVVLRKAIKQAIEDAEDTLIVTGFTLIETYFPWTELEKLPDNGKVSLVALGWDDNPITRANAYQSELGVQVAYQVVVDPTDTERIDRYVSFIRELRDTIKDMEHEDFSWVRTETLKDENGTPFHFVKLREASTFESYFTIYFTALTA